MNNEVSASPARRPRSSLAEDSSARNDVVPTAITECRCRVRRLDCRDGRGRNAEALTVHPVPRQIFGFNRLERARADVQRDVGQYDP